MPYMRKFFPLITLHARRYHLACHISSTYPKPKAYLWLAYFVVWLPQVETHRAGNARHLCRIGHNEFPCSAFDSLPLL